MEINNQSIEDELIEYEIKSRITIINIKILGELKNGVKLNTREKHFALDDVGLFQSLKRLYRVDSRESTYEKISELVKDVHVLFNKPKSLDMERDEFIKFVSKDLIKAKKGLLSLKDTYHDDKTFTAQIDVEIGSLGRLIDKNIDNKQYNTEEMSDNQYQYNEEITNNDNQYTEELTNNNNQHYQQPYQQQPYQHYQYQTSPGSIPINPG